MTSGNGQTWMVWALPLITLETWPFPGTLSSNLSGFTLDFDLLPVQPLDGAASSTL